MTDTMPERPDRCIMIGQPRSFNLARYFVDFVRDDRPPRGMLQGSTLGRPGSVLNRQNKRHRAWMPLATGKSLVRLPGDQLRTPRRPRVSMLDHVSVWRCRRLGSRIPPMPGPKRGQARLGGGIKGPGPIAPLQGRSAQHETKPIGHENQLRHITFAPERDIERFSTEFPGHSARASS